VERFPLSTSFSPAHFHPIKCSVLIYHPRLVPDQLSGRRTKWTQPYPALRDLENMNFNGQHRSSKGDSWINYQEVHGTLWFIIEMTTVRQWSLSYATGL
jgi:hypothetical protein